MPKPPANRSSAGEIQRFLKKKSDIVEFVSRTPRLLFAIDATASRQPTWDTACQLQRRMFEATQQIAQLSVQLCYYRGFAEFYASSWCNDATALGSEMAQVYCEGGHTQIARVLEHGIAEQRTSPVRALVFIGDAVEETPDTLCDLAGQCGMIKLPLFLFQEGHDPLVERTFKSMARLSRGAWGRFDQSSAATLERLLGAVARYAAGGRKALEAAGDRDAKLLLEQLKP